MKIMMPLHNGILTPHFGHCQEFGVLEVDEATGQVTRLDNQMPPPHEPGVWPNWIADQKTDLVIAGGMGQKARVILEKKGVKVVTGAASAAPEEVAASWFRGEISGQSNLCDH